MRRKVGDGVPIFIDSTERGKEGQSSLVQKSCDFSSGERGNEPRTMLNRAILLGKEWEEKVLPSFSPTRRTLSFPRDRKKHRAKGKKAGELCQDRIWGPGRKTDGQTL